ncbi:MAG: hypothetical protein AB9907_04205 [Flexilinea sp.]|jgi:hypothetical protein
MIYTVSLNPAIDKTVTITDIDVLLINLEKIRIGRIGQILSTFLII